MRPHHAFGYPPAVPRIVALPSKGLNMSPIDYKSLYLCFSLFFSCKMCFPNPYLGTLHVYCCVIRNGTVFHLVGRNFRCPLKRKCSDSFQRERGDFAPIQPLDLGKSESFSTCLLPPQPKKALERFEQQNFSPVIRGLMRRNQDVQMLARLFPARNQFRRVPRK